MSTPNKTQSETSGTGNGSTWQSGMADSFRDLLGLQFRTAQFVADKSLAFGQAMTDFCHNQMNETIKLSQEYAKYGWSLSETLKKGTYEFSDRAFRSFGG